MTHVLKTWPDFFAAIADGRKTFEVRKDDRGFAVGDFLTLEEFSDVRNVLTGSHLTRRITYKLDGGHFGIAPGYCVLGIAPV